MLAQWPFSMKISSIQMANQTYYQLVMLLESARKNKFLLLIALEVSVILIP
jgi:hypothetical protein